MRNAVAILSLFCLFVQTFYAPFFAFRLEQQRDVIASSWCVNKDDASLECFGDCYINKHLQAALQQAQDTDQQQQTDFSFGWQLSAYIIPSTLGCTLSAPIAGYSQPLFPYFFAKSTGDFPALWSPPWLRA